MFSLQIVQKCSTTHALIHVADKTRHETEKGNYVFGIFVDFQNAFDKIDHHILLKKQKNTIVSKESQNILCIVS